MGSPVFVGFQRILVAYDASPHSEHAVNVALSIAGDMKAKLFVLAVVHPPELAESAEFNAVLEDTRDRYEHSFAPIREQAKQREIELETDVVVAQPHYPSSLYVGLEHGARTEVCTLSGDDRALIGETRRYEFS